MRRLIGTVLLAAAAALDCETENSPFGVSRFLDANGTTCGVGKYLCGDTREYAYCFEKWPSAEWTHPSHIRFNWTPDKDNTEVNIDGNCIHCTELTPSARKLKQLRVETETRKNSRELAGYLAEAKKEAHASVRGRAQAARQRRLARGLGLVTGGHGNGRHH